MLAKTPVSNSDTTSLQAAYTNLSKREQQIRILFISDCYLENHCWAAFHKSLIRNLAVVCDSILAVRANSFIVPGSAKAFSPEHESRVLRAIRQFDPDVVFAVNRAGLSPAVLEAIPRRARIISLFIDFYDRCPEVLKVFDSRDFIWGTGIGALKENFLAKYATDLSCDQVEFTLWCSDTAIFKPLAMERDLDVSFVGTAFPVHPLADLITAISNNVKNRQILVDLYLAHRENYVYDLVQELTARHFDFAFVEDSVLPIVTSNSLLQAIFSDQISGEKRIRYLAALEDTKLAIYGEPNQWWTQLICSVSGGLLSKFKFESIREDTDLVKLYNRSKIGLNIQHDHARNTGISIRAFDIIASRALLLTEHVSLIPFETLGFKEGEDIITFSSPLELKEKCHYYLHNDKERERVIESAFNKLRAGHTLRHRMAYVFSKAGLNSIADRLLALNDADVNDSALAEKLFCLDGFSTHEKIGRDYEELLFEDEIFEVQPYLNPGDLGIQCKSFRVVLPFDKLPVPGFVKGCIRLVLKQSARIVVGLGKVFRWRVTLTKLPD